MQSLGVCGGGTVSTVDTGVREGEDEEVVGEGEDDVESDVVILECSVTVLATDVVVI